MLRGFALAVLLFASAHSAVAQQASQPAAPPLPCPAQPSPAPQSSAIPAAAVGQSDTSQPTGAAWHCVSVKFNYDFTKTPPCTGSKPKHPCVAQFAIYDTSSGTKKKNRILLFNVPLPPAPSGVMPISGQSPNQRDFALGWHKLGVGALDDTGKDSHMKLCDSCATWIEIQAGPTSTPSAPASGTSTTPPTP
ncbi:MAG TPA: hypothetical protein VEJ38_01255 [Candidatus Acidoferrales bacterium]|nr:hypothetical protein [Candidatus Acidoferrales bacterium]